MLDLRIESLRAGYECLALLYGTYCLEGPLPLGIQHDQSLQMMDWGGYMLHCGHAQGNAS